jgi:hypothetical protein
MGGSVPLFPLVLILKLGERIYSKYCRKILLKVTLNKLSKLINLYPTMAFYISWDKYIELDGGVRNLYSIQYRDQEDFQSLSRQVVDRL